MSYSLLATVFIDVGVLITHVLVFFCGTVPAPAMAELAGVATKDMKGVGFAHLFGVFNLAYGIGTCRKFLVYFWSMKRKKKT